MDYKFHEKLAAEMVGADIDKMFTRTREPQVVLARMMCMFYLEKSHRLNQDENAQRFGLAGHCSTIHAVNTLNDRMETDEPLRKLILKYLDLCYENQEKEEYVNLTLSTAKDYGIHGIVHEQNMVFIRLMDRSNAFLSDECTDAEVLEAIEKAEESIEKLRFNFTK
jgi:hypothetical protein